MPSTLAHSDLPSEATWPQRLSEGTTSAEVISLPLWNLTPLRSVMVWRRPPSVTACVSARSGTGLKLAS